MPEQKINNLVEKTPVVVILGHIDHGKSKLLDFIRKSNIVEGEAGGITQHVGAYQIEHNGKKITFLDTPGHEAFSAIRSRGAHAADIAVLVVAADEGIKVQTKEAIAHAKAAGVPMIVAINKIDKPEANVAKAKEELAANEVMPEEWGGNSICVAVSAKTGENINELLDNILLVAEMAELKVDLAPIGGAKGVVLESSVDKRKGVLATILPTEGVLRVGDYAAIGKSYGKIKGMENFLGEQIKGAEPAMPAIILGLKEAPNAGDKLIVVKDEKEAKRKAAELAEEAAEFEKKPVFSMENLFQQGALGKKPEVRVLLKADVSGSLDALKSSVEKIKSDKVELNVIKFSLGAMNENDINDANLSKAIILGFNIEISRRMEELAQMEGVEVKTYRIIYELIDELKSRMKVLLPKKIVKTENGRLRVLALFNQKKGIQVVGGKVISGKVVRNSFIDVFRGSEKEIGVDSDKSVATGRLAELQSNKVKVDEVTEGQECGISFGGEPIIKEGDVLLCYNKEEMEQEL